MSKALRAAKLHLSTTPHVIRMLRRLHATGMYGPTMQRVAERLICERLRQMFMEQEWSRYRPLKKAGSQWVGP